MEGVLDCMLTVEDTIKNFVGICLASPHAFYGVKAHS